MRMSSDKEEDSIRKHDDDRCNADSSAKEPNVTAQKPLIRRLGAHVRKIGQKKQKFAMPNPKQGVKALIATDAWRPQVNGVVRTVETLEKELTRLGNRVRVVSHDDFFCIPAPTGDQIRLAILPNRKMAKIINDFQPDAIHIPTEGTIGLAARRFCIKRRYPFTTSFHTRFPEYIQSRFGLPPSLGYRYLRSFHRAATAVMVSTEGFRDELTQKGFAHLKLWRRGIDINLFRPGAARLFASLERPLWLYVGRVSLEKNLPAFLSLDLPGTKIVVGEGPHRGVLMKKFPEAVFTGSRSGEELRQCYCSADVFVFPSLTDTFGLVNLEAMACGLPVAAFPVRGPVDIMRDAPRGCGQIDSDLRKAALSALAQKDPVACRAYAENFSWNESVRQFIANLAMPGYDEAFWLRSSQIID